MRNHRFRLPKVTPGFVLLWTMLYYLGATTWLLPVFAAALIHEAGHIIALMLTGGKIHSVEFTAAGLIIRQDEQRPLTYAKDLICVLSGPFAGLLFALLFLLSDGKIHSVALGGMCLTQSVFNLLPSAGLDGGRALQLILHSMDIHTADRVLRVTTTLTGWFIAIAGAFAFVITGNNPTLIIAGIYATFFIFQND